MTMGLTPYRGAPKPPAFPAPGADSIPDGTVDIGVCAAAVGAAAHPVLTNVAGEGPPAGAMPVAQLGGTDIPPTADA